MFRLMRAREIPPLREMTANPPGKNTPARSSLNTTLTTANLRKPSASSASQEEANQYLLRHRTEFDKLREETRKIAQADSPDADRLTAITQQRAKLRRPIHEIFDRQIEPHLEKLPTRAQRAAAEREQPPATQP